MIIVNDSTFDFGQGAPDSRSKRSVVTIGAYDGVHRGHQAVMIRFVSKQRFSMLEALCHF
ncbi:MAG: hypothetical protein EBQ54_08300 [Actinobacteria bacterium]|nr:hypothetical protein [Actinomycetota bacterium]